MAGEHASLRSAGWVSLCALAQLVIQFVFQLLLAKYFGASEDMDAFVAALALPTVLSAIFFGSLSYTFVPIFSEQLDSGNPKQAWATAGNIGAILVLVAGSLSLATFFLARPLTGLLYPGFAGERFELTVQLLRILGWLVLTNGLITHLQAIYHCHRRFALPALSTVVGTAVTLALVVMIPVHSIVGVGWAVLAGSVVAVVIQLPFPVVHLRCGQSQAGTRRCLALLVPLVVGAVYYRIDPLVDRYLASALPGGSIAQLGYAWRVATALLLISTGSFSVVVFPNFARHWAAGRTTEFRAEIAYALRFLIVVLVPLTVALLCYHEPLIRDLLERGKFTSADTRAVALLLVFYLGAVIGAGLGEITSKVFYSLGDTRTPVFVGVAGFTLGVILKVLLIRSHGAAGIAVATSFYFLLTAAIMSWLIARREGNAVFAGTGGALGRALVAGAIAALVAYPIVALGFRWSSAVGAVCGGLVYAIVLLLERDEFLLRLWHFLTRRTSPAPEPEQPDSKPEAQAGPSPFEM